MSTLVMSLKRLYLANKVTDEKLQAMVSDGKITQSDYEYITES